MKKDNQKQEIQQINQRISKKYKIMTKNSLLGIVNVVKYSQKLCDYTNKQWYTSNGARVETLIEDILNNIEIINSLLLKDISNFENSEQKEELPPQMLEIVSQWK